MSNSNSPQSKILQDETTQGSAGKSLLALRYQRGSLKILNQLLLPHQFVYEDCSNSDLGFSAIKSMRVRGAPAIALTAALSLAAEIDGKKNTFADGNQARQFLTERLRFLSTSRPTAVNLADAITKLVSTIDELKKAPAAAIVEAYIEAAEGLFRADLKDNQNIGNHGAQAILQRVFGHTATDFGKVNILTHCNTGSLATAGYGTALGVIRSLNSQNCLGHAFCTETRPYNQGARLTAFELVYEQIPATLITDSMAAFLMQQKKIHAVIVGADRVVNNGDTANKIGTYQLAIAARYHNIPFYVAAPTTSIDTSLNTGAEIPIEERPADELTQLAGVRIAAQGIGVWNPSFDVTPSQLITAFITERGLLEPDNLFNGFDLAMQLSASLKKGS